jgi:hypothetical protein
MTDPDFAAATGQKTDQETDQGPPIGPEASIVDEPKSTALCKRDHGDKDFGDVLFVPNPLILALETLDVDEIAMAIWQRQRDSLGPDAITHYIKWRDPLVPEKFWNEFVLDAQAVLSLLYRKHFDRDRVWTASRPLQSKSCVLR